MPEPAPYDVLRAFDAALNRAIEAARVVEDYTRFTLDDAHLTRLTKELRHDLVQTGSAAPLQERLAARDTLFDVGTSNKTESELARTDACHVCSANLSRLHQSLRSLEEFSKTFDPGVAQQFEQLRYRSYTLSKALGALQKGLDRLPNARLYVLLDGRESLADFKNFVAMLCETGIDIIQLRDKKLADRQLVERARALVSFARQAGVLSIMNDRPDVAALSGADGVHVGQEELRVKDARSIVGPRALVGVSTHDLDQAHQAVLDGADYLGLGPTFPSPTKEFDVFPGLEFLREATSEISLPAFAIGGINQENLEEVLAAGATRVAVGSAVTAAPDPIAAVQAIQSKLDLQPSPVGGSNNNR